MFTVMHKKMVPSYDPKGKPGDYEKLLDMKKKGLPLPAGVVKLNKHEATEVWPEPGSVVTNYDGTRSYRVQPNGSIRRIQPGDTEE